MGKKIELVIENEKSDVDENNNYRIGVKYADRERYLINADKMNSFWNPNKEDNELVWVGDAVILGTENKRTGKNLRRDAIKVNTCCS